ncbi:NADPH:quinone reductase [Alteribacter natronophilus]|uniref:NADPH:quinone reductase n=1 Tax=Alteribacter natronophilus TaxID=2583810 RepID=UPI00110F446A|nr:NADPH:quinone reductase [Alteribacter natronophilus]TMW70571.1 NADPH:quinone reductase [Alteribacter natronophilus]
MRAVAFSRYGGPEVLEVIEKEKPEVSENDVLVRVGASGINPVDTYFRKGIRPVADFPSVPHFDLAGTVVETGSKVTNMKVGDRVWATNVPGTAAEFVAVPSEKLFLIPPHITEAEGAAVAMAFMTAHLSLHYRAGLKKDETVLIYGGAGSVGNAAIQLAKLAGATVIATAGSEEKKDLCKESGADDVILYHEENTVEKVVDLTGDMGVDVILDMSLSENMESDLEMIKTGGRIVTIGSPENNAPQLPWRKLNQKHASLMGVLLFTAPPEELRHAGEAISTMLNDRTITPHLAATYSFEEASQAHEDLEAKKYNGNLVLVP